MNINWTKSELYYIDLGILNEAFEEEIFIFNDGECWVVLESFFSGERVMHLTGVDGAQFLDIEAARKFAEGLIDEYMYQLSKAG